MEKLTSNVLKFCLIASFLGCAATFAEKMDESTHSLVIDKLERALDLMEKGAPERQGVVLRLADLYSDRARLKAMTEVQKNCDNCEGSKEDRAKALGYYKESLPKAKGEDQGKILVQMAHLNNMNGQSAKAEDIYHDVIKKGRKGYESSVVGSAYFNIGEIHFRKGQFKEAKRQFEKALKQDVSNRGFVEYRLAWCDFNLGLPGSASKRLVKILTTPSLSSDPTFKEDVSRDLPTFVAHGNVGPKEIAQVRNLSPEKTRKVNLYQLGTETDRLGKKSASLLVWAAYAKEGEVTGPEKIEVQIRVAQSEFDLGRLNTAVSDFGKAIEFWQKTACDEKNKDKCNDLKLRMRNFVLNWNKKEKINPSVALLHAYETYLKGFPDDAEMTQWAALVARDVMQYRDAVALFRKSALLAKNDKSQAKVLEGSLLGEIEMAEKSKDLKLREDAYTFYIETNPQGEKAFESRFERANVWYQQGKYQQAFSEFHYIATQPGSDHHDIKVKAADLALDTLVLLKDEKSLEVRAGEYARLFPERKKEYGEIARKAAMNEVAESLNNNGKAADTGVYKASLVKLKTVNLAGASDQEKTKYWKNRLTVAMQAHDLDEVNTAANGLLSVHGLSEQDRELAYSQKEWVAELKLDFKDAYRYAKQLSYSKLSPADRDLRLAFLAELSGANPRRHYEDYLRHEKSLRQRNLTRVTLVQRSPHPWSELKRQLPELKATPDLLAPLVLETYGRDHRTNELKQVLAITNIGHTPQGKILAHQVEFGDFEQFKRRISHHRLKASSDPQLQRTLKERLSLLAEAAQRMRGSIRHHDFTMEVVTLHLIAIENRRLGNDLMRLPTPHGLNGQQTAQYRAILQQKANGFFTQAGQLEWQWQNKWNENTFAEIEKNFQSANWEIQNVLKSEIQILAQNAPDSAKNRLYDILKTRHERPSQSTLMTARRELQQNPFDQSKIERLRELEKQAGQSVMVSYLEARLNQMRKGSTL